MAKKPARASDGSRAGINDDIGEEMRLTMYRMQVEIRESEQRAFDLFLQNLVKGTSHLSLGQEAVAAGFAAAMKPGDLSFCTYRGHAHTLARGVPIEKVLGELMQRDNGLMRGKGGSMHLTSVDHGVMGSYAIIGAHLPIACGAAWRALGLRSPVSWRSSCTGYGLTAPSSVGPSKPQRRYPLHDKRSSSSRLTRAEPRRSRGDDGRGDLAECPEPKGSNAPKVAGQIGTPRSFSPHHAAAKAPTAKRSE